MPFARRNYRDLLSGPELDSALRSCGLRLGRGRSVDDADIELTLASVARDGLPSDYRLIGILAAWLEVHHDRVNVVRLKRIIRQSKPSPLEGAWWSTVGRWLGQNDSRWASFRKLHRGKATGLEGDEELTSLMLQRHGVDQRFAEGPLRIHAKLLRSRWQDVDSVEQLARRHAIYRSRIFHGTNYRADVWAELDRDDQRSIADVARAVGCAYESARAVAADWRIAQQYLAGPTVATRGA